MKRVSKYTMDQLRAMSDEQLNRVVLEQLGYTAPDRSVEDEPSYYLLFGPDRFLATVLTHRVYFDPAPKVEWPEGWETDGNDYYVTEFGWDSVADAFAAGPQYVSDLNLAWELPFPPGEAVEITVGVSTPARAIVLAWLSMGLGEGDE